MPRKAKSDKPKRKPNKWLIHVKKIMKKHKGQPLKEILKIASKSYKKK